MIAILYLAFIIVANGQLADAVESPGSLLIHEANAVQGILKVIALVRVWQEIVKLQLNVLITILNRQLPQMIWQIDKAAQRLVQLAILYR